MFLKLEETLACFATHIKKHQISNQILTKNQILWKCDTKVVYFDNILCE